MLIEYPSNGLLASSKRVENITRARELLNAPTPQNFGRLNNDELVTEFQSGGLTELAKEVATAEIQSRSIDISQYQARLPDPRPEPETAIAPIPCSEDLVLLARFYDVSSAYLLQSRLDAEGLPSVAPTRWMTMPAELSRLGIWRPLHPRRADVERTWRNVRAVP